LSEHFTVYCVARRQERLEELAAMVGGVAVPCDVTDPTQVARLAEVVGPRLDLLVNNAGGALGLEPLADDDLERWDWMYKVNVLGAARVTQALLPAIRTAKGQIIFVTSTASEAAYEGGGGYCGAKAAEHQLAAALRLELVGDGIRVAEIAPGMVYTEEFSLTRFAGDQARAAAVYAGVAEPLVAEDVGAAIAWIATRPAHVNIDHLTIRPQAQAAQHKVVRTSHT
jgi:NADP-dependent 3-hydroxy acid dehydrogenase YdfG